MKLFRRLQEVQRMLGCWTLSSLSQKAATDFLGVLTVLRNLAYHLGSRGASQYLLRSIEDPMLHGFFNPVPPPSFAICSSIDIITDESSVHARVPLQGRLPYMSLLGCAFALLSTSIGGL